MSKTEKIISYIMQQLSLIGENFGWQMGKVGANYENGYMKCNQDSKAHFRKDKIKQNIEEMLSEDHIVDSNKMIVTNADRIRNMTEEELVEYLGTTAFCLKVGSCRCKQKANNCSVCITMWLREETEVEE